MRRLALLLLPLTAACLPSRDNGSDPVNAPHPQLLVIDRGQLGASTCSSPTAQTSVVLDSRGRCLGLEASGTTDPNNFPLTFRFAFLGTNLAIGGIPLDPPLPLAAVPGTASLVAFDRQQLLGFPVGASLAFGVTATDSHGFKNSTTASVVLTNDPPIARSMAPLWVPVGGFGWTPGSAVVTLDGSGSRDPDGDPLYYTWTVGSLPPLTTTSARIAFSVPVGAKQRSLVSLTVADSPAGVASPTRQVSPAVFSSILVEDPPVWSVPFHPEGAPPSSTDDVFQLVDTDQFPVSGVPSGLCNGSQGLPLAGVFQLVDSAGNPIVLESFCTFEQLATTAAAVFDGVTAASIGQGYLRPPEQVQAVYASDPTHNRFWEIDGSPASATATFLLDTFSRTASSVVPGPSFVDPQIHTLQLQLTSHGSVYSPLPVTDTSGNLWGAFLTTGGAAVLRGYSSAGTVLESVPTSPYTVTGLSARPGSAEVWALESPSGGGVTGSRIVVFEGSAPPRYFDMLPPLSPGQGSGLTFFDSNHLWVDLPGTGLLLLDATSVEAAGSVGESQVLVTVPGVFSGCAAADPGSGECWVSGAAASLRVEPSGTATNFPPAIIWFSQPNGDLWFNPGTTVALQKGFGTDPSANLGTFVAFPADQSADPSTGGLWLSPLGVGGVARLSIDGSLSGLVTSALAGGQVQALPILSPMRVSPDGSTLWGTGFNGEESDGPTFLYQIGNDSLGAGSFPVLPGSVDALIGGGVLEPSAPLPSSTPFAWYLTQAENGTPNVAWTVTAGSDTAENAVILSTPATGYFASRAARSLRSNRLCVMYAQQVNGGNPATTNFQAIVDILNADSAGNPQGVFGSGLFSVQGLDLDQGNCLGGAAASAVNPLAAGGPGDACWAVMGNPIGASTIPPPAGFCFPAAGSTSTLIGSLVSEGGNPPPTLTFSEPDGMITSVAALNANLVWLTVQRCTGTTPVQVRVRVDFVNGVPTATEFPESREELLLTGENSR